MWVNVRAEAEESCIYKYKIHQEWELITTNILWNIEEKFEVEMMQGLDGEIVNYLCE